MLLPSHFNKKADPIYHTIVRLFRDKSTRKIMIFLTLNLSFTFVEIFYGWISNSLGLMGDGFHMLFDSSVIIMSLIVKVVSEWKSNSKYSYGYGRAQVLTSFINALLLCYASGTIVFEAIDRIYTPQEIHSEKLVLISVLGLIINLVGLFAFESHHHHFNDHHHHHHNQHGSHSGSKRGSLEELNNSALYNGGIKHSTSHSKEHLIHQESAEFSSPRMSFSSPILEKKPDSSRNSIVPEYHSPELHFNGSHSIENIRQSESGSQISHHHRVHSSNHTHEHAHSGNNHGHHDHSPNQEFHHLHHSHSHSQEFYAPHSHSHEDHKNNSLFHGMFLHVLADTLGSVMVIISSCIVHYTEWTIVDPICSLILSFLIFVSAFPLLKYSSLILMNSTPESILKKLPTLYSQIHKIDGVIDFYDAHFWTLFDDFHVGSLIVIVSRDKDIQEMHHTLQGLIKQELNIQVLTLQIEYSS